MLFKVQGGPEAHVVSIENAEEQVFIQDNMASSNLPGDPYNYWVGLVKNGAGEQFV